MYEIIKQCINTRSYDLNVIVYKIDTLWTESKITDGQRDELMELARNNADPKNSYASELDALKKKVSELELEVELLKNQSIPENPEEPANPDVPQEPVDEFKPYEQPAGAHDGYMAGDKVLYNGLKYICIAPYACVYNPDAYPAFWELVE